MLAQKRQLVPNGEEMKYFILSLLTILLVGCGPKEQPRPLFEGNVEFHKINGEVVSVTVTFPRTGTTGPNSGNQNYVTLTDRADVEALELQMQSMLKDLQYVMEQMPVYETDVPQSDSGVRPLPE